MTEIEWSLVKYDLKTAVDVLGLPTCVKTSRYRTTSVCHHVVLDAQLSANSVLRLEKRVNVCYVRVKVLPLDDANWYLLKKGQEFVRAREAYEGQEVLVPLRCQTRVRLLDRTGGKLYHSVKEVYKDYPRRIRVEEDMVCAAPGSRTPLVVTKGTVMTVDRLTQTAASFRGFRDTYLICKDVERNKEVALRLESIGLFRKVPELIKYSIEDFVEQIPLPQTVEFVDANPTTVVSLSDRDAQTLLVMLGGPVQLVTVQVAELLVGLHCDTRDVVAIPADAHFTESALVYIPTSACDLEPCDVDLERVLEHLYLFYGDMCCPLVLKPADSVVDYSYEPDTPPIPPKTWCTPLFHTESDPDMTRPASRDLVTSLTRQRIFSDTDANKKVPATSDAQQTRGLGTYITRLGNKLRSAVHPSASAGNITLQSHLAEQTSAFVCYLNMSGVHDNQGDMSGVHGNQGAPEIGPTVTPTAHTQPKLTCTTVHGSHGHASGNAQTPTQNNIQSKPCVNVTDNVISITEPSSTDAVMYAKPVKVPKSRTDTSPVYATVTATKRTRSVNRSHACDICNQVLT